MTDTDQLAVWLREAMDAAERDAKEATPGPWVVRGLGRHDQAAIVQDSGARNAMSLPIGPAFMDAQGSRATADARHAARHDPAAVLRRIAADRKLLDLHTTPHTVVELAVEPVGELFCGECGGPCTHMGEAECEICGQDGCDTVRLLAEGWGWTEEAT